MNLKREIKKESSETVWFCGCPVEYTSTIGTYDFDQQNQNHRKFFDDSKVAMIYVCELAKMALQEDWLPTSGVSRNPGGKSNQHSQVTNPQVKGEK